MLSSDYKGKWRNKLEEKKFLNKLIVLFVTDEPWL